MTNAEKFLKDGVIVEELADEIAIAIEDRMMMYSSNKDTRITRDSVAIYEFFNDTAKPTLTEDERVILRNIDKNFKYIARVNKQIQVCTVKTSNRGLPCDSGYLFTFNHLFQFIKEGEEYEIEELLKNENV